jgi:hypothetical protein
LESRLNDMLRESRLRYQATIAGALAVQKGCTPDETVEKNSAAGDRAVDGLNAPSRQGM